jgi:hypothetical protein
MLVPVVLAVWCNFQGGSLRQVEPVWMPELAVRSFNQMQDHKLHPYHDALNTFHFAFPSGGNLIQNL